MERQQWAYFAGWGGAFFVVGTYGLLSASFTLLGYSSGLICTAIVAWGIVQICIGLARSRGPVDLLLAIQGSALLAGAAALIHWTPIEMPGSQQTLLSIGGMISAVVFSVLGGGLVVLFAALWGIKRGKGLTKLQKEKHFGAAGPASRAAAASALAGGSAPVRIKFKD